MERCDSRRFTKGKNRTKWNKNKFIKFSSSSSMAKHHIKITFSPWRFENFFFLLPEFSGGGKNVCDFSLSLSFVLIWHKVEFRCEKIKFDLPVKNVAEITHSSLLGWHKIFSGFKQRLNSTRLRSIDQLYTMTTVSSVSDFFKKRLSCSVCRILEIKVASSNITLTISSYECSYKNAIQHQNKKVFLRSLPTCLFAVYSLSISVIIKRKKEIIKFMLPLHRSSFELNSIFLTFPFSCLS